MPFRLPEEMPTGVQDLTALRSTAHEAFAELKDIVAGGGTLSDDDLESLRHIVDEALPAIDAALSAASEADSARAEEITALLTKGEAPEEEESEEVLETEEVVAEAERVTEEASKEVAVVASSAVAKRTSFAGTGRGRTPAVPRPERVVGWQMDPSAPQYKSGLVGFREMAESIDSVRPGSRVRGGRQGSVSGYTYQTLGRLNRDLKVIDNSHELVDEIKRATAIGELRPAEFDASGALVAAGGWCAPSETLYDFCAVPEASDLVSVPEITIRRGGVRWPIEPDLSAIFDSFEFFFTEPELEADPPPLKECVEVPCPEEFEDLRLSALGYCVEAGILQNAGWPELIEWFIQSLAQEHLRAISRRTILDMVAGSTAVSVPADTQIAAGSSILNSLELMAINLRLNKGYGRNAIIEGVAPSWLHAVIRADMANQQGVEVKTVTDAQIDGWFSARNISLQYVGDWQTRGVGQPGNLGTVQYPGAVQVLMYPAGTWFRALDNVIQFGTMYPRDLLQINRFTRFFTEDGYAIGKRCNDSLVVNIPICPNGGVGERLAITCNTPEDEVQTLTITGTPTGGTFTLSFNGATTTAIAYNASAATIDTAMEALSTIGTGDIAVTGGALPGTPVVFTFTGALSGMDVPTIIVDDALLTGGTDPAAAIVVTTQGGT